MSPPRGSLSKGCNTRSAGNAVNIKEEKKEEAWGRKDGENESFSAGTTQKKERLKSKRLQAQ